MIAGEGAAAEAIIRLAPFRSVPVPVTYFFFTSSCKVTKSYVDFSRTVKWGMYTGDISTRLA